MKRHAPPTSPPASEILFPKYVFLTSEGRGGIHPFPPLRRSCRAGHRRRPRPLPVHNCMSLSGLLVDDRLKFQPPPSLLDSAPWLSPGDEFREREWRVALPPGCITTGPSSSSSSHLWLHSSGGCGGPQGFQRHPLLRWTSKHSGAVPFHGEYERDPHDSYTTRVSRHTVCTGMAGKTVGPSKSATHCEVSFSRLLVLSRP